MGVYGSENTSEHARLIFGNPLSKEDEFDPKQESVMNILGESSREREESQDVDMEGGSPQGEAPAPEEGCPPQGEKPTQENYDNWWETPGEPSADQLKAERESAIDEDTRLEEEAQQWIKEEFYMFDDQVVGAVMRSVSSSNP